MLCDGSYVVHEDDAGGALVFPDSWDICWVGAAGCVWAGRDGVLLVCAAGWM